MSQKWKYTLLILILSVCLGYIFQSSFTSNTNTPELKSHHQQVSALVSQEHVINSESSLETVQVGLSPNDEKVEPDFIYNCAGQNTPYIENAEQIQAEFITQLQASSSSEHQFAAILFNHNIDEQKRFDLLINYKERYPDNPMLMFDIIGRCSDKKNSCDKALIEQAVELDRNNAALWLLLANYYLGNSMKPLAFEAMELAIKATSFKDYYFNEIALFMESAEGGLNVEFPHKAAWAIGIWAAKPLWTSELTNLCMENEELTPEQNQLCVGVGKLMEQNSSSTIESLIGNKIQQKGYQREGNEELVASLQKQADINEKLYAFSEKQWSASTLMLFDEKLFQYWLDAAINYGEHKAQQLLYKEAITLSKNEYYNPCPNDKN
ncbi:hypothetical protein [Litorilituus lipolyticus]|uniref:Uncharacterized protein n=1 Tax=Litorilituus lipolyticus TaxID=2491017 RepID=A0A502L2T6_9GAMM|nr:hypothetical protein [Litorilituus lipolyticus]TPH16591.1 hypothetical protein EPA86_06350 [Litorilituus lipolyticus]